MLNGFIRYAYPDDLLPTKKSFELVGFVASMGFRQFSSKSSPKLRDLTVATAVKR